MTPDDLDQLIEVVVRDPEGWPQLLERCDRNGFVAAVVQAARSLDLDTTAEVVSERLRAERRSWLERWV